MDALSFNPVNAYAYQNFRPAPFQTAFAPQPMGLNALAQMLTQLMKSISLLANSWTQVLQPSPPILPRPQSYVPSNTDYGWDRIQGFQGSPRISEAPEGYEWSRELLAKNPNTGNSSEPFRYFLSPKGRPGIEMREIAPGQYLPILNQQRYPSLPPNFRTSYPVGENPPAAPEGYEWAGRWPGSKVLTPKGMPDVNLQLTEYGWMAVKHFDQPNA
ncbi:MAG: hypothetical protein U0931_11690 [Vulcanimicrobiota bacterium]